MIIMIVLVLLVAEYRSRKDHDAKGILCHDFCSVTMTVTVTVTVTVTMTMTVIQPRDQKTAGLHN